jgi:imidazolonepropionase-like amidohydrolase
MNASWVFCGKIMGVLLLLTQLRAQADPFPDSDNRPAMPQRPSNSLIPKLGDLDQSGSLDATDLVIMKLFLAGRLSAGTPPFTAPREKADLSGDGQMNAADSWLLESALAGDDLAAKLVLVNGTLIDGTGLAPIQDAVLAVNGGGKIVAAGRRGDVDIPFGAAIIDVQGGTMLPGFINAHVHDAYSAANLEAWAQGGVTTVRDESINQNGVRLRDLIVRRDTAWNQPRYARLISAGWMITAPGGYGRLGVSTPEEAGQLVAEELEAGADLIKVAVEDGIAGRTDLPVLSAAALEAAVAMAHARGKPVSAHITDARFLQTIVDAGMDDAAHVTWDPVSDALFRQMITRRVVLVPTLTVLEAYGALTGAAANLRRFVVLGGEVALGNDYTDVLQNNFPHFELGMPMHEIQRMSEAEMTAMQIIVAATRNAARVCGLDHELGTLETGKSADVLVVNGDPLGDIRALTDVRLVIHRGTVIRGQ